jgi:hypothetical protein
MFPYKITLDGMPLGKVSAVEISVDKRTVSEVIGHEMFPYKMTINDMSVGKMSIDEMTTDKMPECLFADRRQRRSVFERNELEEIYCQRPTFFTLVNYSKKVYK